MRHRLDGAHAVGVVLLDALCEAEGEIREVIDDKERNAARIVWGEGDDCG